MANYGRNDHQDSNDRDNVRFWVSGSSTEVFIYRSWEAVSYREKRTVKRFGFLTWSEWATEGDPIPIGVEFQDGPGAAITNAPITASGSGWRQIGHYAGGSLPSDEAVTRIAAMRITYEFEGKPFEIVIGRDWVRPAVIIIVIILVFVAIGIGALLLT
jgi:hypothetical protein